MSGRRRHRILMIDDDRKLGELLEDYFARFGHRLLIATTAAEGRRMLRREEPELVILDVMLPDADGLELCRELRSESDLPILMLTARGDLPDRVLGFELGADDYVAKPFEPRELVARVEARVRRRRSAAERRLTARGLVLETATRRLRMNGDDVALTTAEFELLRILLENRGRVLSREQILHSLGTDAGEVFDRSVDMLISRLRTKLGDDPRSPRFVATVRGVGYQFVGADDP
jgi:DNA-binding response OmpR family regulator